MIEQFQHTINEEVEKFSSSLSNSPAELYEPIRYTLSLGGKRIRPLFVLIACDLFGGKSIEAVDSALAIELFHNFTLVHDDIMDNAPLRRGQPTVHEKWNSSTAILSGDVMMVKAYQNISKSHIAGLLLPVFNEMAVKVCEGQQLDLNYEKEHKISVMQYYKMIELKTAELIASSFKIGAIIGGAAENDAKSIYEFGKNIGMAFQLQDDLLDAYGDEEKFGKQKGGDILSNKKTFLLLKARELTTNNPYLKEELEQWISFNPSNAKEVKEKIENIIRIFDFVDIKQVAENEVSYFHNRAVDVLGKTNVEKKKKEELLHFASSLIDRMK